MSFLIHVTIKEAIGKIFTTNSGFPKPKDYYRKGRDDDVAKSSHSTKKERYIITLLVLNRVV